LNIKEANMPKINGLLHPKKYSEIKVLAKRYVRDGYLLISFAKAESPEAKKIKDYLLGITFAREGMAFQYRKNLLFVLKAEHDPKDLTALSQFL
jgi:hypothetical protein